jgi:hypothetical protein
MVRKRKFSDEYKREAVRLAALGERGGYPGGARAGFGACFDDRI